MAQYSSHEMREGNDLFKFGADEKQSNVFVTKNIFNFGSDRRI